MSARKVILITGGSSGLGKVIAQHLVAKGHAVYCTSRNAAAPSEVMGAHLLELDVTSEGGSTKAISEIMSREKRIDVIINNAGMTLSGPTLEFTVDDFKNVLDINLIGAFRLLKAAVSFPSKPSLVINITSLNGYFAFPNFGLYGASKFGMEALGLALRHELAPATKVVNVAPGALLIDASKKMSHKPAREKSRLLNWVMPLTSPEDVAVVIDRLINASSVPPRVLIGRDAHIINAMQKLMPMAVFDRIVSYIWKK